MVGTTPTPPSLTPLPPTFGEAEEAGSVATACGVLLLAFLLLVVFLLREPHPNTLPSKPPSGAGAGSGVGAGAGSGVGSGAIGRAWGTVSGTADVSGAVAVAVPASDDGATSPAVAAPSVSEEVASASASLSSSLKPACVSSRKRSDDCRCSKSVRVVICPTSLAVALVDGGTGGDASVAATASAVRSEGRDAAPTLMIDGG